MDDASQALHLGHEALGLLLVVPEVRRLLELLDLL